MKSRIIFVLILIVGVLFDLKAQIEPHFSQYYMHPLWLNPALTGAINGDYRVSVIHRNQWNGITNAFSTIGVSADFATNKNLNFGANFLQQSAGDAGYKYLNGQASISYSGIRFGKEGFKTVTFALQGGLLNRRFDFSKLRGGSQYRDYFGYDPGRDNGGDFNSDARYASTILDMGAGMAYYDGDPDKTVNFFGGFSAAHITQPKDNLFSTSTDVKLPVRYALHGGARVILDDRSSIVPNMVLLRQSTNTEFMLGGYYQITATDNLDLMAGVNYRFKDALYPYLGLNFNNFIVGFSYDVNTSQLGKATSGANSYEFSLMYSNKKGSDKGYFKCPRF